MKALENLHFHSLMNIVNSLKLSDEFTFRQISWRHSLSIIYYIRNSLKLSAHSTLNTLHHNWRSPWPIYTTNDVLAKLSIFFLFVHWKWISIDFVFALRWIIYRCTVFANEKILIIVWIKQSANHLVTFVRLITWFSKYSFVQLEHVYYLKVER